MRAICAGLILVFLAIPAEPGQLRSAVITGPWQILCDGIPQSRAITIEADAKIRQTLTLVQSVAGVWYVVWAYPTSYYPPSPYQPRVVNAHGVIHQSVEWHQHLREFGPDYVAANGSITLVASCTNGTHMNVSSVVLYAIGTP